MLANDDNAPRGMTARRDENSERAFKVSLLVPDLNKLNLIVEAVLRKINEEKDEERRDEQLKLANEILTQFYLEDGQPITVSKKSLYNLISGAIQIIQTANKRNDDLNIIANELVNYIKKKSALISARCGAYYKDHDESNKRQLCEYVSNIIEYKEYLSNAQEISEKDLEESELVESELEESQQDDNILLDDSNLLSKLKLSHKDITDTYEYKTMSQLVEHMRNCLSNNKNPAGPYRIFIESGDKLENSLRRTISHYYEHISYLVRCRKFDVSKVPEAQTKHEILCNIISISSAYFDTVEEFIEMLNYRSTVYKYINLWAIIRYKMHSYCVYKSEQIAKNSQDFILAEVISRPYSDRKKLKFLHFNIY